MSLILFLLFKNFKYFKKNLQEKNPCFKFRTYIIKIRTLKFIVKKIKNLK